MIDYADSGPKVPLFDSYVLAEVAEEAAMILDESGWCQNAVEDPVGRLCMMGAMGKAARKINLAEHPLLVWALSCEIRPRLAASVYGTAADALFAPTIQIPAWNDAAGRTKEDVVAVLQKTAAELRERVTPGTVIE